MWNAPQQGVAPRSASNRGLLRRELPDVYRENDFGVRFLEALETILDPTVGILDNLAAHFDPAVAPSALVELMGAWLGAELHEQSPVQHHRQVVARTAEVTRMRGTRKGLQLELELLFPGLSLSVEDGGRTAYAMRVEDLPPPGPAEVVVRCEDALPDNLAVDLSRRIAGAKPAHVGHRLSIRRLPVEDA